MCFLTIRLQPTEAVPVTGSGVRNGTLSGGSQPGTGKGPSVPQGRRAQGDELGNSSKRPNARGGGAWTLEIRGVRTARGVDREEMAPRTREQSARSGLVTAEERACDAGLRCAPCPVPTAPPPGTGVRTPFPERIYAILSFPGK